MNIIKELGLDTASEEEKNQILVKVTDSLLKRLLVRAYEVLNETDRAEFERLTTAGDQAAIEVFLKTKLPNLDQVRDEEMQNLIAEMKTFISEAAAK